MVDIKDVPRDGALAGLPLATDGEFMRRALEPHFGPDVRLLQVKVERFTYKPGHSARLSYRIKLRDRSRNVKTRHVLHGRMEPPESISALYAKMLGRDWVKPAYGPALLWLPDLSLLLWGFPNDPKLKKIDRLAQPEKLLLLLAKMGASDGLAGATCDSQVVKYVPGKRLVMRHELRTAASPAPACIYSKTYGHERGGAIFEVMRSLWERSQDDEAALASPEPLGFDEKLHTIFLRGLPGIAAITTLKGEDLDRRMREAGRGLARIHTSGVNGLQPWTEAHEFENFLKSTALLQRYDAGLAESIARLRARGQELLAEVASPEPVPIHGAFRFTQLLSYRDRLALVDFDGFRQGHPMCDVGSFAAHLLYVMAKSELSQDEARRAVREFLAAYAGESPWGLPERALQWYTAIILVSKHAQKCVKRAKDEGDAKIRHMLGLAEDLLARRLPLA